jgi:LacI family transcriptional regulator, galactose operon repressor
MATLRDVARRAGVSASTVSHVLNNTRVVSDTLRQRVLASMRELEYEPNAVARMLSKKRSTTIGLIVSDIGNPFFASIARGVEDVAQMHGYTMVLCNSDAEVAREAACLRALKSRQIDGVVLASAGAAHDYLNLLVRQGFPIVLVDRELPDLQLPAVLIDNERAAYRAVRHLIGRGHTRIGMLAGRPLFSTNIERIAGYRRALREAGLDLDPQLLMTGGSSTEAGAKAATQLLELDRPPTAIFAGNNLVSIGALHAIVSKGLSLPEDVALVTFDDLPFPWSDVFRPRLTTVAQPTYELGRRAAEMLIRLVGTSSQPRTRRVVLEGKLVIRESSGVFARRTHRKPITKPHADRGSANVS